MRKLLLILSVLVLFTISATNAGTGLVSFTVINKSGLDIEISLTGMYEEAFYYLRVPEGDRSMPNEVKFSVIPDQYNSSLFYVELWDPVYGYTCSSESQTLDINGNTRLVVIECDRTEPNLGEPPSTIKYGATQVTGEIE